MHPVYAPSPLFPPEERYRTDGVLVPQNLTFIVATGRAHRAPWSLGENPMADSAWELLQFQRESPGVLAGLSRLLFPSGFGDLTQAVPSHAVVIDFVTGWSILPYAQATGQMPEPWQRCPCGVGVMEPS